MPRETPPAGTSRRRFWRRTSPPRPLATRGVGGRTRVGRAGRAGHAVARRSRSAGLGLESAPPPARAAAGCELGDLGVVVGDVEQLRQDAAAQRRGGVGAEEQPIIDVPGRQQRLIASASRRYGAVGVSAARDLVGRPGGDDPAAVRPAARAQLDQRVAPGEQLPGRGRRRGRCGPGRRAGRGRPRGATTSRALRPTRRLVEDEQRRRAALPSSAPGTSLSRCSSPPERLRPGWPRPR